MPSFDGEYIIPHTHEVTSKSAAEILKKAFANDEPVFVMRAKDVHSIRALASYFESVQGGGSSPEFVREVGKIFKAFQDWRKQNSHQIKFPD